MESVSSSISYCKLLTWWGKNKKQCVYFKIGALYSKVHSHSDSGKKKKQPPPTKTMFVGFKLFSVWPLRPTRSGLAQWPLRAADTLAMIRSFICWVASGWSLKQKIERQGKKTKTCKDTGDQMTMKHHYIQRVLTYKVKKQKAEISMLSFQQLTILSLLICGTEVRQLIVTWKYVKERTYLVRRQTSWRTSSLMAAVPRRKLYSNSSRMRPWRTRICRRAGLVASARSSVMQWPVTAEAQP